MQQKREREGISKGAVRSSFQNARLDRTVPLPEATLARGRLAVPLSDLLIIMN